MKKLLFSLLAIGMIGTSVAQMAIPGEVFAGNPSRFNGRKVTIKNVEVVKTDVHGGPSISGPASSLSGGPGAINTPSVPATHPCRPPRGFSEVSVFFNSSPEFKGCFFMADNMKQQLDREMGHENTPAQLTFRGDSRTGYNVTFYRLGM